MVELKRYLFEPVGNVHIVDAFDVDRPSVGVFGGDICWAGFIGGDGAGDGADHLGRRSTE